MEDAEDDVAVIGMGCNFPGGEGLDNFWKVLLEGKNCVVDIPAERFDTNSWYNADVNKTGKTQTTKAALIEGFNEFDHMFFGISEVEADSMDPQQKLLLQCTYWALEDAGVAMESISRSRTGVYIGLMNRDYEMIRNNNPDSITHFSGTGTATSVAANRISFTFNLTGPSFVLDSACSSSLVALHVACQALKQGDCEMALCGGVNCVIEPRVFVALSKTRMISPEGTSRPFSISADGYGRGEGCGVILLKPLRKAIKDYNKIWGIICKTAINQDGRSSTPITKPSMTQQEELLRGIYSDNEIANVQYIEAHGTGTPVGDATEAGSISNVIANVRPPCSKTLLIGSVKGNIGHTESAAGVAGLIKVLLMMKHKTIVPSVFYSNNNSSVDVKALNLQIPSKTEKWEANQSLGRVAGVNSFGFGGTNAHVILREHSHEVVPITAWVKLFVLSASSEKALILTITDTHQRLCNDQTSDLHSISYTSACRRSHCKNKFRKAFLTFTLPDLKRQLKSELETKFEPVKPDVQVVFVFCGNGVSYWGMCRQLMREVPAFREKVREVENAFQAHQTIDISRLLAGECDNSNFSQLNVVQPLLFLIQIGIATVLKHWGVKPNVMLGHSVGEVAAAHCSGLLSLEDAVKVLYHRSTLQSKVAGGKMLVVSNVAVKKVLEVLAAFPEEISVAAYNSPQSCTLSGDADAIDALRERLIFMFADKNLFLHVLDVPAAYHSYMMDPVLEDLERSIGTLSINNTECELFSTVTGKRCSDGDFSSGTYWANNIRKAVLFDEALCAVIKDRKSRENVVFVEIGPRRALQRYICETLGNDTKVFPSVQPEKDCDSISLTLARLFEFGINVNWNEVYRGCETLPTTLPACQFVNTKKNVNFEALRRGNKSLTVSHHRVISPQKQDRKEVMYNLSLEIAPYLWEHKNNNVSIAPGAFYVELAFSTVMANLMPKKPISLLSLSVTFENVLTLNLKSQQMKVIFEQSETEALFQIQSPVATHASGTIRCTEQQSLLEESTICVDMIYQRCKLVLTREEVYSVLFQAGFEYGPLFKQLDNVRYGTEFKEAVTTFQVPAKLQQNLHECVIHPVLLDYFMQMTSVIAMRQLAAKQGFPSRIGSITVSGPLQNEMVLYLRATQETEDFLDVCGCFSTTEGNVLVELKGVRISFLGLISNAPQSLFFHNETVALANEGDVQDCKIKAIIFEDQLGIAKGLRPYLCPESVLVEGRKKLTAGEVRSLVFDSLSRNEDLKNILFLWGVEDLSHLSSEGILECSVTCCEMFRQIVLAVKESKSSCAIRVITYRSTETTVDHVSSAFVLSGMLRTCSAEMAGLYFQLVDLASITSEDISTLAHMIKTSKQQEVRVSKGQVSAIKIAQTTVKDRDLFEDETHSVDLREFVLQTTDPYRMANLSTIPANSDGSLAQEKTVEIQLTNVCIHSSDFFPVSTSHFNFGKTFYWNKHVTQNHKVLALDFSGIVTCVGRDVKNLKVGDHIASCYPVTAATKIVIPEAVCYGTKTLPFFRETPCVSYFILAWEMLQKLLSEVKKMDKKLAIISPNPASALVKVLALTASRSGWNVSSRAHFTDEPSHFDAFVFLPPFDHCLEAKRDSGGLVKHVIFVRSSHMSPLISTSGFASKNGQIHMHNLDVACVLQRANLQAQNRKISNWLLSLGFEAESLPLRGELNQTNEFESYFMTTTVQQVVFHHEGCDFPTSENHLLTKPRQLFKQHCVYIVTGGLSGLGFETVKFVAQNGGGCIAILSRSAPSDNVRFEMDLLQKRFGVIILNVRCDVSVSLQVVDAISKIGQRFSSCPIKGVFHSAAVLHDALIESLDESLFRKVLKPKVSGALNLHFATLHNKLDFFVCYSSISSFIGNASQCNYSAANSFLDTFCHYRRNLGLAGQSINWGPLNLGLLLNKGHFQKFLEAKGLMTMSVREVHETLKKCLLINRPQQVICKFNFRNLNLHVLSQNVFLRERLSNLVEAVLKEEAQEEPKIHLSLSTHESLKMIIGEILSVSAVELDDNSSLSAIGIDSLLAMTLQNKIFQETGVNVPLVVLLDPNSTLLTLVNAVLDSG
ncbi:highly reducing polyketide synthase 40 [Kryptolebias marmoratus]|uniref:Mycocerosic acid synthase-like polyketide synthase n=1 Tax=Kryptolebias marmoratus TaxID=37003 RepID=A0A3Q3B685_KRYMA|nr:highly reducing polyketide synthase 40 [Kryptolebias marmoratus]